MKEQVERYVVPVDETQVEYLKIALQLAVALHKKHDCTDEIMLLVPNKEMAPHGNLAAAISGQAVKQLIKRGKVNFDGRPAVLESIGSLRKSRVGIIVGIFARPKMLNVIDDLSDVKGVVVAPNTMADVESWIRTWNPHVLGRTREPEVQLIADPVVELALKRITDRVNLSAGLAISSYDKDFAVGMLKCIHKHIGLPEAERVREWALRNGWMPRDADDLASVVKALRAGKRKRGGTRFPCTKKLIEDLRKKAQEEVD